MSNYLHILIDSESRYPQLIREDLAGSYPILSWSKEHFVGLLKNMLPDQLICVWFHVKQYGENNEVVSTDKLAGIKWSKKFVSDPELQNLNYYFTTSGSIDDDIQLACNHKLFGYENMDKAVLQGMLGKCLNENAIVKLQKVSDILDLGVPDSRNYDNVKLSFPDVNNWRTGYFKYFLDDNLLKKVLGTCFAGSFIPEAGFKVFVVEPGLSGAFVLRIEYYDPGDRERKKKRILKIQRKNTLIQREIIATQTYRQKIEATNEAFFHFEQEQSKVVDDFDCCVYFLAYEATTIGSYLKANLKNLSNDKLEDIINQVFKRYDYNVDGNLLHWQVRLIESKPWSGDDLSGAEQYPGLKIGPSYRQTTKASIVELVNQFPEKYLKEIFDLRDDFSNLMNEIFEFIDSGKWKYKVIDGNNDEIVPISFVHGDFNVGNILVNETDGLNPKFIDLSQICNHRHALLDIGKLSVEFEKRVVPDTLLNDQEIQLKEWCDAHYKWLRSVSNSHQALTDNESLKKLYFLIDIVKNKAINRCTEFGLTGFSRENALRQFLMVRLSYHFRMINRMEIIPIKRLFALKAIVDALTYLVSENNI